MFLNCSDISFKPYSIKIEYELHNVLCIHKNMHKTNNCPNPSKAIQSYSERC